MAIAGAFSRAARSLPRQRGLSSEETGIECRAPNSDARLSEAITLLEGAYRITNSARFVPQPLVRRVIEGKSTSQAASAEASWPY